MKSRFIWIVIVLAVFLALFWFVTNEEKPVLEENFVDIAEMWVLEDSPTYVYDGENLVFKEEKEVVLNDESAYSFTFTFDSRHGGYGDRAGKIITQVITLHEIEVVVFDGEIISAVSDGIFDEMNEIILE